MRDLIIILHLQDGVVNGYGVADDDGFRDGGRFGKGVGENWAGHGNLGGFGL